MKAFMVIREPSAFQLLADETRRKILYLLRVKEMTVSQMASDLGLTSQAVYHHVRKLLKGNMIEVAREERVGHLIESYYRATAEDFLLSHGKITARTLRSKKLAEQEMGNVLAALARYDLRLDYGEGKISELAELRFGIERRGAASVRSEIEDRIWNDDELSLMERTLAIDLAGILLMTDKEFAQHQRSRSRLRAILLSLVR